MDYTSNNNTQRMRQSMGPVDQPNWNGGPRLNHNPQVMNNQVVVKMIREGLEIGSPLYGGIIK